MPAGSCEYLSKEAIALLEKKAKKSEEGELEESYSQVIVRLLKEN